MEKNSSALSAGTVEVERGTKCTFSLGHSGDWFIYSPGDSATFFWKWVDEYGVHTEYTPYAIRSLRKIGTSIDCFFIDPGTSTVDFWSHTTPEIITFQVGDPTQTASDKQFSIQPVVAGVTQSKITLNIPATQVAFPFTPQPNYSANAKAAKTAGKSDPAFMDVENHHNGIGAWGDSLYYPDNANPPINKATKKRQLLRRRGANFNFGAMMRGAGYSLNETLYIAQLIVRWKHPIVEQYAIAGGWTWEEEKEPALDYKGHSVFTFNLTNVPNGDLPF
jgi:hypothetical protein